MIKVIILASNLQTFDLTNDEMYPPLAGGSC